MKVIGGNYILKIVKLYLIWSLIYFPLTVYSYYTNERTLSIDSLFILRGYLITGEQEWSWHLWYLLALIYTVVIYRYILMNKWSDKKTFYFTITIAFVGFLLETFESIRPVKILLTLIGGTRNGLFEGFTFFMLGAFINRYHIDEWVLHNKKLVLVSLLLLLPLSTFLNLGQSFFLVHIVIGLVFSLLLATSIKINVHSKIIRELGIWLYFCHMYAVFIVCELWNKQTFKERVIPVFILSFLVTGMLYYLSNKIVFIKRLITS